MKKGMDLPITTSDELEALKNLLDEIIEEPSEGCTERILDALNGEKEGI